MDADTDLQRAVRGTVLAELAYTTADGGVDAAVVSPLVDGDGVVLPLPYAERPLADALAGARAVALAPSDERLTLAGWRPLAVVGRVGLRGDLGRGRLDLLLLGRMGRCRSVIGVISGWRE
jgi:hypothetical protein